MGDVTDSCDFGFYSRELSSLQGRVTRAVEAFGRGELILVGDDGRRENEADLVFHAGAATAANVNFAINYARGLLCVSVSHELADNFGFHTAPRIPGGIAHTGFTLSVDAREGIGSGISAADRGHTIRLMASGKSTHHDFISPGHVFPVRANSGGLLARTGHTEALLELCHLAKLPAAAAMCEILGPDGDALKPDDFITANAATREALSQLRALPYLSTVDLLWYRIFYGLNHDSKWEQKSDWKFSKSERSPKNVFVLNAQLELPITLNASYFEYSAFELKTLRIEFSNGAQNWDNSVPLSQASAMMSFHAFGPVNERLTCGLHDFCDLSGKEGIHSTHYAVRRLVTLLRALQFIQKTKLPHMPVSEIVQQVAMVFANDAEFLRAVLTH